jgi:hypothetical protein
MNKTIALALSLVLAAFSFSGCKSNLPKGGESAPAAPETSSAAESPAAPSEAPSGDGLKTGLAVISSVAKSTDAGEQDGLAQTDSTVVAVTVDKDGKNCQLFHRRGADKNQLLQEGKLLTDINTEFKGKQELGTEYGMGKASFHWQGVERAGNGAVQLCDRQNR